MVGYEGKVGQIVDQFRLICAPINSDGSPGTPVVTTTCFNGGISGTQVGIYMAPQGSWMTGFRIGDVNYFGRSGTLTSIEGYSQSYTNVINGSANRFLNQKMAGGFMPQFTTDQYAPAGTLLTGMNYFNGWQFSNTVQFKYQPLVAAQELASFAVTDNCTGNLNVNLVGNTTFTCANVGSNPLTIRVTDANGNVSTCTATVIVTDNNSNCTANSILVSEDPANTPFVETSVQKSKIYPNPSFGVIKVVTSNEIEANTNIMVFDVIGKVQVKEKFRLLSNKMFEMDVSNYPTGMYFIKINSKKGVETIKFIRQ